MHISRVLTGFAVVTLATVPAAAAQTFEGVIGLQTPNGPMEAMVKGGRARLNTQSPMGTASILFNPAAKEMYIVVEAQKMVMVMKTEAAAQRADSTSTGTDSVTALGTRATVAGHECEVFRFRSENTVRDVCISSGLGELGVGHIFTGMGAGVGMMMSRGTNSGSTAWTRALARKGGFPLRVADTTGTVQFEVTRVERKRLDDALFTPPADFQRMEMPSFGRPPGTR